MTFRLFNRTGGTLVLALTGIAFLTTMRATAHAKSLETQSNAVVAGTITVESGNGSREAWDELPMYRADGTDRAAPNNYSAVQVANDDSTLYMRFLMDKSEKLGFRHNVFIDVDEKRGTGFVGQGSGYLPIGAEYLIQGGAVFRFTAPSQTGWSWDWVENLHWDATPTTDIEISLSRDALGDTGAFSFVMNAANFDLNQEEDYYPNNAYLPTGGFFTYQFAEVIGIDELTRAIKAGETDSKYDLNNDGEVNAKDRNYWVTDIQKTRFGDSNLDRVFNSTDMVSVFQAGEYEDNIPNNSTWATGDWSGDGEFTSNDMILALQDGPFESGVPAAASAVQSVPEPSSVLLIATGASLLAWRRRRA
jgi:hypothetical protein